MTDERLTELVNQSGFALQIALADAIQKSTKTHGWHVTYAEHAWKDIDQGESGFTDLVVRHSNTGATLVIECKRVLGSEQGAAGRCLCSVLQISLSVRAIQDRRNVTLPVLRSRVRTHQV